MTATGVTSSVEVGVISAEQARLVLDVTRMLAVTTDLNALLQRIAEAATALLSCERASIFVHDPATDQLCTRIALQSAEIRVPSSAGIVGATFTSNAVQHVPHPYEDPRFNREVDKKTGFTTRNILAAPMASIDRKPLGVVQAINKRGGAFDAADIVLIQTLADQAGVALQRYYLQLTAERAASMRHEMNLARKVQDAMLPKSMPRVPGFDVMGWTRPASVTGGDCFDLWETLDGRLAVFLADASGHGLAPTIVVSQVRTLVRAFAEIDHDPRSLLQRANLRLSHDLEAERFVTAFLAFISPDGTMNWCSAGHGPILLRCGHGDRIEKLVPPELPLGVMAEMTGEAAAPVKLEPGGSLAVVSDGIFEAMNAAGEQLGMPRVIEILDEKRACDPKEVIETLTAAATTWTGSDEPVDDQTIVVVRRI